MKSTTLVTHPGGAHKDDFLACAVLLTRHPVVIERRDPTEADLANPDVYVIDIGGDHSESLHNFDHHQFPRETVPTCALSLVLKHLGLYEDAREFCDWLEVAEWFDCRGPADTAAWLGVEREALGKLNSPIDLTVLRRFASQTIHLPGEPIWELMRMIGSDLVGYITSLRDRLNFVEQHSEIWDLETANGSFKALYMPRTAPLPTEPSAGLGRYAIGLGDDIEILALVYPDSRGEGFGMRRFNDSPLLDFSDLEAETDVHFAHARGFIAKTSTTDAARLQTLLKSAYKGPTE